VRFVEEGVHVAINDRLGIRAVAETDETLHQAIQECVACVSEHGIDHIPVRADVSKQKDVTRIFAEVIERLGDIAHHTSKGRDRSI
jgi:NAD(P)-dependent dehydrogenase (short-subunit alcohol dehydrogenase family)